MPGARTSHPMIPPSKPASVSQLPGGSPSFHWTRRTPRAEADRRQTPARNLCPRGFRARSLGVASQSTATTRWSDTPRPVLMATPLGAAIGMGYVKNSEGRDSEIHSCRALRDQRVRPPLSSDPASPRALRSRA